MLMNTITAYRDKLHVWLSYHFFITPVKLPLEKKYRHFARLACDYLQKRRSEVQHYGSPRHYVVHRFSQPGKNAKKILITHGWMSRAAYMTRFIDCLHKHGFDIYALDFPAHGESKGLQLQWPDAIAIIRQTLNESGPFYAVIGHSFGGAMLLGALNFSRKYAADWQIQSEPEKMVLLASPMRILMPLTSCVRQMRLPARGYLRLRQMLRKRMIVDLKSLNYHAYMKQSNLSILCVHGEDDRTLLPRDTVNFCNKYPNTSLALLPGIDHYSILLDERVEQAVGRFLIQGLSIPLITDGHNDKHE